MTTGAAWDWQLVDAGGRPMDQPMSPAFGTRFDAEQWLGEQWRRLVEQGVASVVLRSHDAAVAAALPLRAALGPAH